MSTVAHTGEARFLQRLALAAASTLDARDLVRLVISETTDAMDVDVCSVYLLEPDAESLLMTATNGLSQAGVGRVSLRLGEGITGWAAEERRPIVVPDVRAEPRFRWLPGVDQARFVSMCSVPILSGDRLVGVLNVQSDERRDFTGSDVALLAAIAAHVAGALERSELQGRLEARVAELRRSDEVHRRLSGLALAEAGLDAICAAIARTAGAGVAAYDTDGERLAAGAPDGLPERLSGFADPERRGDDLTVLPLRAGAERLGWLAAGPADEETAPGRRAALDHGATVISLELMRARAEAETERRLRGDLVEELLGTPLSPVDAERLAERAARLGYRIRGPVWVLVLEPDDEDSARAMAGSTARRRLARTLADEIGRLSPGGLAVERGAGMVLLVPGEPGGAEVERLARAAVAAAGALAAGAKASCGISSGPGGPADLHRLSEEARGALAVARRAGLRAAVAAYDRLGVERLLLELPRERLTDYVAEWLGPLRRHAQGSVAAAPLAATLEALVAEGWSLRPAARRLHVHVNTLLYRMRRVEEVTGRSLADPDVRLGLALALRAQAFTGEGEPATARPPARSAAV
ncbi:MAG: two-component system, sensor histidine kinase PdtaS [Miltoncostaeaceae bacterium]|nr:two-component system, sensor histidine kinase PdtaS [Miltoncostaeaceae bacterium]